MQSPWYAWLTLILGILLILPVLGVTTFGSLTTGIISWLVPLIVIIIGIVGLMKVYSK